VCADLIRTWLEARGRVPGPLLTSHPRVDESARSDWLDRVHSMRARGKTSRQIAEALNREGSLTPQGLDWTAPRLDCLEARERSAPKRMGDRDINFMIGYLSDLAGIERKVKPHALRHQSITRVLDLTNGNVRAAMRFARHASPGITLIYDDNRTDLAGDMAKLLGDDG